MIIKIGWQLTIVNKKKNFQETFVLDYFEEINKEKLMMEKIGRLELKVEELLKEKIEVNKKYEAIERCAA